MLKRFLKIGDRTSESRELREIGELVIKRIDRKISELKTIEKKVEQKIDALKVLIQKAEELHQRDIRKEEIISLYRKGLKIDDIASSLKIPSGEVELVLRLCKNYPQGKNFLSDSRQF
ncbi:MAG: cytochrome P450 [Thermodesulfovibrionales bacterium]|nr:cytochrome P450 [Thermodesulfovibrionales bacterium]